MDDFIFVVSLPILFGLSGLSLPYLMKYFNIEYRKRKYWQTLSVAENLTFVPRFFKGAYVTGLYRGHVLKLDTVYNWKITTSSRTRIHLKSSLNNLIDNNCPEKAVQNITNLFYPDLSPSMLRGQKVQVLENGQSFHFEHFGLGTSSKYFKFLFDLLSDLAEAYPTLVFLAGEIVPALQAVATKEEHALQQVAYQLLCDIERQTTKKYRDQPSRFLCPTCLVGYAAHKVRLSAWKTITYYGCRICGQSREYFETANCWVIAVLDSGTTAERNQQEGTLRVNWLVCRTLFDFDEIEIVQATDEEVERFAVQVGNDTDPTRKSLYKRVRCIISSDCKLSENTLRILKRMFGQVKIREEIITLSKLNQNHIDNPQKNHYNNQ